MSEIKIDLRPVAQDLVEQLRARVPVRTGRLKNSITYQLLESDGGYLISFELEDYFKWLKERDGEHPVRLPSPKELSMAAPPLPKMNNLGIVRKDQLSGKSQKILESLNIDRAMENLDYDSLYRNIKEIIEL